MCSFSFAMEQMKTQVQISWVGQSTTNNIYMKFIQYIIAINMSFQASWGWSWLLCLQSTPASLAPVLDSAGSCWRRGGPFWPIWPICLFAFLAYLPICLWAYLPICLFAYLPFWIFVYLTICLLAYLDCRLINQLKVHRVQGRGARPLPCHCGEGHRKGEQQINDH